MFELTIYICVVYVSFCVTYLSSRYLISFTRLSPSFWVVCLTTMSVRVVDLSTCLPLSFYLLLIHLSSSWVVFVSSCWLFACQQAVCILTYCLPVSGLSVLRVACMLSKPWLSVLESEIPWFIEQAHHKKNENKLDDFHSITQLVLTEKARQFNQHNVIPFDAIGNSLHFCVSCEHLNCFITFMMLYF
jgi:hypothetical protein